LGQAPRGKPFTREAYKRLLSQHNQQLKQIGQALGIHQPLTSYVLRHSWASTALAHEVPVALISQAMGHTSEKTTRCYLQQLDQSTLDQANLRVIAEIEDLIIMKGNPLFRE
ncbi:MAG: tyrosine-type recombinase/integrase, partial [Parabacteroides sp.]|nr:tyrosine-type recombinase/integrase [Parabacteroides sp.]